ncbi:MAG: hypothetical protein WCH05_03090 [Chlorobiaceae bacterium]
MTNIQEKLGGCGETQYPHFHYPIWDPVPDWLRLDEQRLREFGRLQIQTRLKELELSKAKLEQLQTLLGK